MLQTTGARRSDQPFREALMAVPHADRDAWLDAQLGLGDLPADGPHLPRGCVPYLPSPVDALLRVVDRAPVRASDVFVDVGSGIGRASALVHLLTGARVVGLEIQPELAAQARALAQRLRAPRLSFVTGDADRLVDPLRAATVVYLYCPFATDRVTRLLAALEPIARRRPLTVCCLDMPRLACSWLTADPASEPDLTVYRS